MPTEDVSARFADLDGWPTRDSVEAMFEAQLAAVAAVRPALGAIADAADEAAAALHRGGRLVYAGAGTSGRVGVQDGAELPPTFDWPFERLVFAMAGGQGALVKSAEGAEDDEAAGARAMDEALIGPDDVVIGVAASGTTPYTVAAVRRAAERGAVTVGVANNAGAPLLAVARHKVLAETGAEVVAGSTRMKAGTAQKVVLNLFSTAVMIRLGRVHGGLMVHMRASNAKLHRRAADMVVRITACTMDEAYAALEQGRWEVKTAVLIVRGASPAKADLLLAEERGILRAALARLQRGDAG
ncbi:N-acetylmuramic acid 6-phosphate etherase [uncultured Alsobacter sp.]|uniref:N-acetylmuramic acid 6-phosphate etherase n=1 Tax=uncultured Alsobacter sp. TaxID=1748258 RepID=UPI0025E9C158|nr:N-acetylmuramic acid 6-phosphate etherase [uncultured Alsobacter sp.]